MERNIRAEVIVQSGHSHVGQGWQFQNSTGACVAVTVATLNETEQDLRDRILSLEAENARLNAAIDDMGGE